jgi:hypothetical protein
MIKGGRYNAFWDAKDAMDAYRRHDIDRTKESGQRFPNGASSQSEQGRVTFKVPKIKAAPTQRGVPIIEQMP